MAEELDHVATEARVGPRPEGAHRVVARQPIVGRDDGIVGFRLPHRPMAGPDPAETSSDGAVAVVAVPGDPSFDADALVGARQLFLRPWPELIAGTATVETTPRRTVLEISADEALDAQVVDRCRQLRAEGWSIALELVEWRPGVESLVNLASVVEIDLGAHEPDEVLDLVTHCRPYDVTMLACGCSSEADLTWAAAAGFELFQGPAIERPEPIGGALAPTALGQVQLATELLDERMDFDRVEEILDHEPALVVQVLQEASLGAGGGLRREVRSVREALVVMGSMRLRQWAALAVLGRNVANGRSDALTVALVRARMCALLAERRGIDRGYAFTAGMLSALDRLLGVPIAVVARRVDVDQELGAAAFRHHGAVGELVGFVADYQVAVEAGRAAAPSLGDVDQVAAVAFASAMSHIKAIERVSAVAAARPGLRQESRFVLGAR
jgi:c-di-GMP-related signal transduction protein